MSLESALALTISSNLQYSLLIILRLMFWANPTLAPMLNLGRIEETSFRHRSNRRQTAGKHSKHVLAAYWPLRGIFRELGILLGGDDNGNGNDDTFSKK